MSAGIVKTTPPATDSPADPMVWTMLFSRIVEPPSFLRTEIASTAIGIEALTVRPARSQIDGRRAEQQSEEDADHDRLQREFGWRLRGRHIRLKGGRFPSSRGL